MRKYSLILITVIASAIGFKAIGAVTIEGSGREVIGIKPDGSTGLDDIFVVYATDGCRAVYRSSTSGNQVKWQKYGYLGAAYAEDIDNSQISHSGTIWTLNQIEGDTGYVVTDGGRTYYFWVTDYSAHPYSVESLTPSPEQECDRTFLTIGGSASRIVYYTINGRGMTLSRDIKLSYNTLVADEENQRYNQTSVETSVEYIEGSINVAAPLCNTYFHMNGDRFLERWGYAYEVVSPLITSESVDAIVSAKKIERTSENEIKTEDSLGGSAPVEIEFRATPSDAAVFTEWQMSEDSEFNNVLYSNSQLDFNHTFNNMGTTYVRFIAANASGTCEYYSDVFTVTIGESSLKCPNAFSPGATPGVNDEWRVSYKSITEFECYIFNRWGKKLAEFHDPGKGWDGKDGGKLVPAGVYYYVIKAKGADGKKYNLSGDINILNYR